MDGIGLTRSLAQKGGGRVLYTTRRCLLTALSSSIGLSDLGPSWSPAIFERKRFFFFFCKEFKLFVCI